LKGCNGGPHGVQGVAVAMYFSNAILHTSSTQHSLNLSVHESLLTEASPEAAFNCHLSRFIANNAPWTLQLFLCPCVQQIIALWSRLLLPERVFRISETFQRERECSESHD
jgi:hypothetical protein